jgi:predicted signal transduction protein with EAL and GGDEF domain
MVRWGGDEFTVLLPQIASAEDVVAIANKIVVTLQPPFTVDSRPIHLTCSMGMATYPEHGSDAEMLLQNADAALTYAKQQGRNNYQFYDQIISTKADRRLTIENLLRSALKQEEFRLYYQPIINITTGKIAKMEALIRWQNPQLGLVSPYIFIPIAEENGAIVPIGEWVLKTACAQNRTWQTMGLSPIKLSVNLSVRQFQQPNLVSTIVHILNQTRLHPSYLELEITESVTMQDTELAKTILLELNQLGITLSMDDFGTGYSSLSYLKKFPFHTLKIDRSFIRDLHPSSSDLAIVNAVLTLGKGLNLNIVAEGVETEELQETLRNLGCEYVQGYLYSPPVPAQEATELLQKTNFVKSV